MFFGAVLVVQGTSIFLEGTLPPDVRGDPSLELFR